MGDVTYDSRSIMIDGQRIWLTSGSVHYFRTPSALWADRLLKAKRAGLNCVSTYVAWNLHEPAEGQWDFEGDKDVVEFVNLADDLGLYVILRPGPYICAEWDFGGLPGWLHAKSGISYRMNNAAFTHYIDKYFAQVLPRLAEHQVSQGGNIILIQNENEYFFTTQPDRQAYLDFISQMFRRSGFDVPVITCNCLSEPQVEGAIECVNGWDRVVTDAKRLRDRQHDAPLIVTEFWDGRFDHWGGEHETRDAGLCLRRAVELLGCGAQINYYMFHGGTNFGFWGSRLVAGANTWQTTSYDYDAPLAEGGGLTEKYYLLRLVNLLTTSMGRYFATTITDHIGSDLYDATNHLDLQGTLGNWVIVTDHSESPRERVQLMLANGKLLNVPLGPFGIAAVPYELTLPNGAILDYSELMPLGLFGEDEQAVLVLHGPAGTEARLSLDGEVHHLAVPKNAPDLHNLAEMNVLVLSTERAMRTWPLDGELFIGPDFAGRDAEDLVHHKDDKEYHVYAMETGKLSSRKIKADSSREPQPPKLENWERICICPEPISDKLEWTSLDRPRDLDKLGRHYGYGWYRLDIPKDHPGKHNLYLPDCADRATLYLNGELLGVWGPGEDAAREPIPASFKKGNNVLVALVDNLGRFNAGHSLGESKGLFGHIWDAKPMKLGKFKLSPAEGYPRRIVPRTMSHMSERLEGVPITSAEVTFQLKKVQSVHLRFENIPNALAILCNERPVGFYPGWGGNNWGQVTLGAELKAGRNALQLLLWGEVDPTSLDNVTLHVLEEPVSADATWGYRPWQFSKTSASEPIKGKSCWYRTTFKKPACDWPVFLRMYGGKKGQLLLNGHDCGRFWTGGPQELYYLPECWMDNENELVVFEELGNMPSRCRLEFSPRGPYAGG
jgi:beta-galactosidase